MIRTCENRIPINTKTIYKWMQQVWSTWQPGGSTLNTKCVLRKSLLPTNKSSGILQFDWIAWLSFALSGWGILGRHERAFSEKGCGAILCCSNSASTCPRESCNTYTWRKHRARESSQLLTSVSKLPTQPKIRTRWPLGYWESLGQALPSLKRLTTTRWFCSTFHWQRALPLLSLSYFILLCKMNSPVSCEYGF